MIQPVPDHVTPSMPVGGIQLEAKDRDPDAAYGHQDQDSLEASRTSIKRGEQWKPVRAKTPLGPSANQVGE